MTPGRALGLVLALVAVGCDEEEAESALAGDAAVADGALAGDAAPDPIADAAPDGEADAAPEPEDTLVPQDGEWFVQVRLVEFGIDLPFQFALDSTAYPDGTGVLDSLALRAVKGGRVSPDLAVAEAVPVAADGSFSASFVEVLLPGEFSVTGSDIELSITFTAQARRDFICGGLSGEVHTLDTTLTMSTFAAVPAGTEGDAPPASCDETGGGFEPIAQCPALVEGVNAAFPSAGLQRTFRLVLPEGYDDGRAWPLVFGFHGRSGHEDPLQRIDGFADHTGLPAATRQAGAILVMPASQGGLGSEWQSGTTAATEDATLFADLLKCVAEQYHVDPARVHVAGHSAGALFTSTLVLTHADVVASAATMSGGLLIEYPGPARQPPFLVAWGGDEDTAFDQDFEVLAQDLIDALTDGGHFVLACDHSALPLPAGRSRHGWPIGASEWVVRFLLDHPRGVDPLPYAGGPPEGIPNFCARAD